MTICTWILSVWLCPSGWVQTRAWCPGKCSAQNFSPSSCARSTVKPLSWAVPWVKADDIVVALYILPFSGSCRSGDWSAYRQRQNPPRHSSERICGSPTLGMSRPSASRVGFMVNSSCSNVRYFSACPVVGIFRADMFEVSPTASPTFCKTSNFKAARSAAAPRTSFSSPR